MPAVLICADTIRSPEMRHEVPAEIMDPFLYAEVDGRRYAVVSQLEVQAVNEKARVGGCVFMPAVSAASVSGALRRRAGVVSLVSGSLR